MFGNCLNFSANFIHLDLSKHTQVVAELGTFGIFYFFSFKKKIFVIFYQVNLTGSGLFK